MQSVSRSCNAIFSSPDEYVGRGEAYDLRSPFIYPSSHAQTLIYLIYSLALLYPHILVSLLRHPYHLSNPTLLQSYCLAGAGPHDEYQTSEFELICAQMGVRTLKILAQEVLSDE